MNQRRLCGALLGIGFCIAAVAEARGNSEASGIALMAMGLTYLLISRSAA